MEPARALITYITCPALGPGPLPGSLSMGQLWAAVGSREGLASVCLEAGSPASVLGAEDLGLTLRPLPRSTLEVFAAAGGLALLAHHLQLYYPQQSLLARSSLHALP